MMEEYKKIKYELSLEQRIEVLESAIGILYSFVDIQMKTNIEKEESLRKGLKEFNDILINSLPIVKT